MVNFLVLQEDFEHIYRVSIGVCILSNNLIAYSKTSRKFLGEQVMNV
jgi:hypothetical protein